MKPTTTSTTAFAALLLCLLASPCLGQVALLETTFDDPSSLDDWSYIGTGGGTVSWSTDGNPGGALLLEATTSGPGVEHYAVTPCYRIRAGEQFQQEADAFAASGDCAFAMRRYSSPDCSGEFGTTSAGTLWGLSNWGRVTATTPLASEGPFDGGIRFAVGLGSAGECRIDNFVGRGPAPPSDIPTVSTIGMILLGIGIAAFAWRLLASM